MKLYHYSKAALKVLKTRRAQGTLSSAEISEAEHDANEYQFVGAYVDHLSFFFDPIPAALLTRLFDHHPVWFKGNELIEHVVETESLDRIIPYRVAESPACLKLLDETVDYEEEGWLEKYFSSIRKIQIQNKERGTHRSDLEKQIQHFKNTTAKYYELAKQRKDWESNKQKYAAAVPHLMIYPTSGQIAVISRNIVVMGHDERQALPDSAPLYAKW